MRSLRARLVLPFSAGLVLAAGAFLACGDDGSASGGGTSSSGGNGGRDGSTTLEDGATAESPACKAQGGTAAVASPQHVRNVKTGETGWFASPAVVDLDGDGKSEIVAALYSTFVFGADGSPRGAKGTATKGRILTYAGAPAQALYYSSSGGRTQDNRDVFGAAMPYLVSVADPYSLAAGNPMASWRRTVTQASMRKRASATSSVSCAKTAS